MHRSSIYLTIIFFSFLVANGCKTEPKIYTENSIVNIHINQSPSRLSPMLTTNSISREVYTYMYLPLADYDPKTYKLTPLLAKSIPSPHKIETGKFAGKTGFTFEIREEASWDDGEPIDAEDYIFTLKSSLHPFVESPLWRSYFQFFDGVIMDDANPRKFTLVTSSDYFLVKEAASTFELYPAHIYDPEGILNNITIEEALNTELFKEKIEKDSSLLKFSEKMNSPEYGKEKLYGAGPYKFIEWVEDQYIRLVKKENWWAEGLDESTFFQAFPKELVFKIIKDETTALTALKDGSLDVMSRIRSSNFIELRENDNTKSKFLFLTPQLTRYYYLALNNRHPMLSSKLVRQALSQVLDVDAIINNLENGIGTRTIGHFNPIRSYYNTEIEPYSLDYDNANALLDSAGWIDSNGNGTRDKEIDGVLLEFNIEFVASSGELGKQLGLIFKENARKVGIEIELVTKDFRLIRQDLQNHTFTITPLVITQDMNPDDPYTKWHSDNAVKGKGNWFGFGTKESDELIDKIRATLDPEIRHDLYWRLQEIMHEEAPVIFLYSPTSKIVVNNKFVTEGSAKRPGYFVNTFKLTKTSVENSN